ncbi:MAG: ATP-binding protein [Bacteroidales bacterium]|jgi:signal transduction histidine kinase|nr:ATP-binding protein [Bacteroidales bacterium]
MFLKKENTSPVTAIVVAIVIALVFSFLFLFLGVNHRKDVYNEAKKLATEISRKAAFETQIYLSSAIMTSRLLEQKALLLHKLKGPREEVSHALKSAIIENPNFLGAWSLWEPDAFDGRDDFFKNDSLYSNRGLLGMGYFRHDNKMYYEIMTSADYVGPHYLQPKELKEEVIIEPYRFRYTGHKQVFFATTFSVPIMADEKFLGAVGIDIDLGSLQKKINKIRPYETGYLSLISNNGTIVTHIDTSLIHKNIFALLNEEDSLSYKAIVSGKELAFEIKSEFTGKKVFRLFYPIIIGKINKPWHMMVEIPIEKATFRSKQLLFIAIGTLFAGLVLLIYSIINIVERKRYEKTILSAKIKAEESDRLKTAFLNNISHEIRTPLNGILGFSELLTDDNSDEQQKQAYMEIIQASSSRLLSTISDVIELSKIQSRQQEVRPREFDVEQIIKKVTDAFETEIEKKNLKLIIKYPDNKNKSLISTDEDKFKRVLSYLLNNAIKFTAKGLIEIGYEVHKDAYLFYVKDTGIGINPENANNIFKFFNQEEATLSRKYEGLGIGLSISKSLVDILGGSIRFESEVGKGSAFYFNLPRQYAGNSG